MINTPAPNEAITRSLFQSPALEMVSRASAYDDFRKGFVEGIRPATHEYFVKECGATLLSKKHHRTFLDPIHKMADALGLGYEPIVYKITDFPGAPVMLRKLPNAAGNPLVGAILLNDPILKLTNSHPSGFLSPALKGIMAHELAHIHHDLGSKLITHFGPIITPLAGMAALWLFDTATHRKQKQAEQSIPDYVKLLHGEMHQVAEEEKKRIDEKEHKSDEWHIDPKWQKTAVEVGRYIAVAALSYGAALLLSRNLSLSSEFRADTVAVELTGDPETYKKALVDIHRAVANEAQHIPKPKTLKDAFKLAYAAFQELTTHAHPKLSERLSYIDKIAAEKNLGIRPVFGLT